MNKIPSRRNVIRSLWVLAVVLVLIQFVPVDRSNPPVEQEVDAPAAVKSVLRQSCYDCHSHETVWPWYSYVAPVSWLVAHDVEEAREHLNFSTWNRLDAARRADKIEEVWEEVSEGEMPLWYYLPAHPDARLSQQDLDTLKGWAGGTGVEEASGSEGTEPEEGEEHGDGLAEEHEDEQEES